MTQSAQGGSEKGVAVLRWTCGQVPEAEKARLREKMLKRREEQDAKALQEKLAASEAARQEAEKQEAGLAISPIS